MIRALLVLFILCCVLLFASTALTVCVCRVRAVKSRLFWAPVSTFRYCCKYVCYTFVWAHQAGVARTGKVASAQEFFLGDILVKRFEGYLSYLRSEAGCCSNNRLFVFGCVLLLLLGVDFILVSGVIDGRLSRRSAVATAVEKACLLSCRRRKQI